MTNDMPQQIQEHRPRPAFERFGPFLALTFTAHAVGVAIPLGILGLAQSAPLDSLLLPYSFLAYCGLILCPLMYWARLARLRPTSCARRFAIAIFGYTQLLSWAIEFAMVRLRIDSPAEAARNIVPLLALFPTSSGVIAYLATRQILKDSEDNSSRAPGSSG